MDTALWAAKIAEYQAEVSLYALKLQAANVIPYRKLPLDSTPTRAATAKCPCCGSREFKAHNDVRICSYCRSEA